MAKLVRSNEHKTFDDVSLLFAEKKEALKRFCVCENEYFTGFSKKELTEHLSYHLQEAEYDACLALLAAIEAAFRLDFDYRHKKRRKDSRSKAVRRISKTPRGEFSFRISIESLFDILALDNTAPARTINLLKIYFRYRHWLAHGRYWQLRIGRDRPTFSDIYQIAQAVDAALYR